MGVMPVLRIVIDGWMDGCNSCFKDCYGWMDGWVGVMPVLRIVVDEMDGCVILNFEKTLVLKREKKWSVHCGLAVRAEDESRDGPEKKLKKNFSLKREKNYL